MGWWKIRNNTGISTVTNHTGIFIVPIGLTYLSFLHLYSRAIMRPHFMTVYFLLKEVKNYIKALISRAWNPFFHNSITMIHHSVCKQFDWLFYSLIMRWLNFLLILFFILNIDVHIIGWTYTEPCYLRLPITFSLWVIYNKQFTHREIITCLIMIEDSKLYPRFE